MDLDKITSDDFRPLKNSNIEIHFSEEIIINSEVLEVSEINGYSPLDRKPFSVVFRTQQKKEYFDQGIFGVIHPILGELRIFLCPIGFDQEGMKYEAVFS